MILWNIRLAIEKANIPKAVYWEWYLLAVWYESSVLRALSRNSVSSMTQSVSVSEDQKVKSWSKVDEKCMLFTNLSWAKRENGRYFILHVRLLSERWIVIMGSIFQGMFYIWKVLVFKEFVNESKWTFLPNDKWHEKMVRATSK